MNPEKTITVEFTYDEFDALYEYFTYGMAVRAKVEGDADATDAEAGVAFKLIQASEEAEDFEFSDPLGTIVRALAISESN